MRQTRSHAPASQQSGVTVSASAAGSTAFADRRPSYTAQRELAAFIGDRTLAQRQSLNSSRCTTLQCAEAAPVQCVRAKPAEDTVRDAVRAHVSGVEGSCREAASQVHAILRDTFADNASETKAQLIMWIEDGMAPGNHTAATVQWTDGTFVVDTTLRQFGGEDVFIGSPAAWEARVLTLLRSRHEISHVHREAADLPLGASDMENRLMGHGAIAAKAREEKRMADRRAEAERMVAEHKAKLAKDSGKDEDKPKKGCCFLTTACVEHRGLPDDCRELSTLRAFRDGYLSAQPQGPALIAEYYRRAPALVAAIGSAPDAASVLDEIYAEITQCVADIDDGDPASALARYRKMVERLLARFAMRTA